MTLSVPSGAPATVALRTVSPRRTAPSWLRKLVAWLGLPLVLVVVWWVASADAGNFFFPPLSEILSAFGPTWFADGRFAEHVVPSLIRLAIGYASALVLGIGLGVAIGLSRMLRAYLEPVLEFFRAIPPPVMIPILMLFFGFGDEMKIVVIATGAIWPILLNAVEGVRGIDDVLRDTARTYRMRRLTVLRTLVLRGAAPQIVTGARQALAIAIILMVISEMFAANNGLGFTIVFFQRGFAIPEMWTGVILLGLIGIALSLIFRIITDRLLAWYYGLRRAQRGGS